MRFALLSFLLLVPSLGGCAASKYWVGGTVDYAIASPLERAAGSAGALPLRVLYCSASLDESATPSAQPIFVRLGDGCVLDLTHGGGTCDLPTERTGPIRISVENVSAAFTRDAGYHGDRRFGLPLTVVVGGTTVDGRYVTYRFTGGDRQEATGDECAAAARMLPKPAPPPGATAEVTEDYWSAWRNGKLDLPPAGVGR